VNYEEPVASLGGSPSCSLVSMRSAHKYSIFFAKILQKEQFSKKPCDKSLITNVKSLFLHCANRHFCRIRHVFHASNPSSPTKTMDTGNVRLSILIPTYNDICVELVDALCRQAGSLPHLTYEVLVADDGSTRQEVVEANHVIDSNAHCKYLRREQNEGRSAIRNYLARQARYELLLFIDSHMSVIREDYIDSYLSHRTHPLVYGGYAITVAQSPKDNLRYKYELSCIGAQDVGSRTASPYSNFHTSNFMIHRDIMLAHPLDERFKRYGYEDVLFGKRLKAEGIEIFHIDNPVGFNRFESNQRFVEKTEEGLCTLHEFSDELRGYSRLLAISDRLEQWHIMGLPRVVHALFGKCIRRHLLSAKPSLFLFKVYRLGFFSSLRK